MSIGLAKWAFILACIASRTSSSKAFAVIATIGSVFTIAAVELSDLTGRLVAV